MALISAARSTVMNAEVVQWANISSASSDTMEAAGLSGQAGAIASVQVAGTFGGATVTLQGSNDGLNYATLKDTAGAAISLTSAGIAEFSTAVAFIRPAYSGASGMTITVTVVTRG